MPSFDDEYAEMYPNGDPTIVEKIRSTMVVARKCHECVQCCRTIRAGAMYERWIGNVDGEFCSVAFCKIHADAR